MHAKNKKSMLDDLKFDKLLLYDNELVFSF